MGFYLTSRIMKNIKSQGNGEQPAISRRHFIQASSALIALPFVSSPATAQARAVTATENRPAEKGVQTCSTFDCGGKCDIRAHVSEGIVTRISTRPDNALDAQMPVMRACVRGRAYRKFVYHPDRLKYPMKRVGKRGEGKFERISWDEATTLIADNLKSITEKYGPASRYVHVGTAVYGGTFSGDKMARRLLNLTGGYLESYHSVSMGNTAAATPYTYGIAASGSSLDTLLETKLVILWGHNPTETIFGHTNYFLQKMKQNGTRFIVVDPRYSDTVSSLANQNPDLHQAVRVLEDESKIQFIVASDLFMTPSAKYADLLLPETSFMERWNIGETWGTASYLMLSEKLIEPEFERRSDYDWLREVAAKLGIENEFSQGRDEKAWIEHIWEQTRLAMPDENLPDFATLQKTRQHLFKSAPFIAFEDNIRDPENHPFPTPSGKIEIFSKRLYDMQHPEIPALSHYVPAHEGPEDTLAKDFPLQLITWKGKNRANSTQYANPWLIEVQQQTLWINPQDAQKRGITHGDMVRIHNSRGICEIPAEVTPRIIPGVVAMQAGAWWQPDENGIDKGGCANVLSSARITALAKGNSHQTMLVEVAKA
ncbi:molybdopterin-dependent oxidoreductase [Salmonella enterica subsp. enterica]|nr:molybdopterin-dependent oxidoreductase [Salmonella enterica subsp. enterica]